MELARTLREPHARCGEAGVGVPLGADLVELSDGFLLLNGVGKVDVDRQSGLVG